MRKFSTKWQMPHLPSIKSYLRRNFLKIIISLLIPQLNALHNEFFFFHIIIKKKLLIFVSLDVLKLIEQTRKVKKSIKFPKYFFFVSTLF